MAGQAPRQLGQKFLGAGVDPVEMLDCEDDRSRLAHAEEHVAEHAEGPLLELRDAEAIEKFLGGGDAEEVGEEERPFYSLEAQELKLLGHASLDLLAGHRLGVAEVSPQEPEDRVVRNRAAIGDAGRVQLEDLEALE